ncbi:MULTISPECIES: type II toxin-antitoxin system Phd/YefM family antitoxin [unclassified Sulfurospirillum]|uniref:type II toxin-antitoxin system Phd/YefM family antitoxin n=1 Tax=unclassified Sulfurospirillum TaxID=2618290 RepID=UPI0005070795|nr:MULTISPECIES: type II toxin-antitoxin system Phd/YefM family antitoxin [unclassified Sulfurospirillum]KFL33341.1 prevent-host-death protein [Sulfurospirillum sp. SCADC]
MYLSQDIKPISYLKSNTAQIVNSVTQTQRAIYITQNGEAKVVVQDIKSFENTQNMLTLLKLLVQSENDINDSKIIEQEGMFLSLEAKLFHEDV